ncbi:hypothetical protein SAMN05192540_2850 [Maribacter dokdonensis]|uniref:Uncharacterized protein n=1 Tax=Maribacter dokdonensis TaxID=320912 RepID=A0A1H4RFB5_9FLAO|nr:hypothetical protein [Maribacter dokdonensis]SEC30585.1 hypothetical protein SAMN05192540_2850 [Maribacter dokdonensis]
MKTKKEIIDFINKTKKASLTTSNTSYSKINKSKDVWWLNIQTQKFNDDDVHLLLKTDKEVIWIYLANKFTKDINASFKIRPDRNAVDLEISADKSFMYLRDIKSGGTGFDFDKYVNETIQF